MFDELIYSTFLKTSSVYVCEYLCGLCGNIGHDMFMVDKNKKLEHNIPYHRVSEKKRHKHRLVD